MGNACMGSSSAAANQPLHTPRTNVIHVNPVDDGTSSTVSTPNSIPAIPERKPSSKELIAMNKRKPKLQLSNSFIGIPQLQESISDNKEQSLKTIAGNIRLTESELRTVLDDFREVSRKSKEGSIDKETFFDLLEKTLKQRFNLTFFETIYNAFDADGNGTIDLVEIATGLSNLLRGDNETMIRMVFGLFDVNEDHSIQMEEMIDFFTKSMMGNAKMSGYKLTTQRKKALEEHLERIFSATDLDKNGTIDFDEFIAAVSDADHPLGMLFLSLQEESED
jgi:Ca2+-binding EF-hand superfamily protein